MALTVATWNINSLRLRLPLLRRLIDDLRPDIVCLQETKVPDPAFPRDDIVALGYPHIVYAGMKSYNGVAILSRQPLADAGERQWCGRSDCRHVYATLANGIEIHCLYVPSGGDVPDPAANDKFAHKLEFLREQAEWWAARRKDGARRVLVGDFNVAPLDTDVWSHKQLLNVVCHTPIEVDLLARLAESHDWIDAVRHFIPVSERLYSWWSYRARDWSTSDRGRRIDHIWVTPALAPSLRAARILRDVRGWPRPSDHVPVVVTLETP